MTPRPPDGQAQSERAARERQDQERRLRRNRRSGRRAGDSGTREAILAAARQRFGNYGYDRTTIRGIAADAGVDPALVHHFYGSKERLFAAAIRLPVVPGEIVTAALNPAAREPGRSLGEHMLRTILSAWDIAEMRSAFLGLLRSAVTSDQAAAMMREFVTEAILGRVAEAALKIRPAREAGPAPADAEDESAAAARRPMRPLRAAAGTEPGPASGPGERPGRADAEFRAALVASQVLGLALTRYVLELEPLVAADVGDLAEAIGPALERYLAGDLHASEPCEPPP